MPDGVDGDDLGWMDDDDLEMESFGLREYKLKKKKRIKFLYWVNEE